MFDSIETFANTVATSIKNAAIWVYNKTGWAVSKLAHGASIAVRWTWKYTRISGEWVIKQATSFWGWLTSLFAKKEEAKAA